MSTGHLRPLLGFAIRRNEKLVQQDSESIENIDGFRNPSERKQGHGKFFSCTERSPQHKLNEIRHRIFFCWHHPVGGVVDTLRHEVLNWCKTNDLFHECFNQLCAGQVINYWSGWNSVDGNKLYLMVWRSERERMTEWTCVYAYQHTLWICWLIDCLSQ